MFNYIGLDISKSSINIHIQKTNQDLQIDNTLKAIMGFYSKLKKIYKQDIEDIIFIFEPTGSYSELLRKFCANKDIKCLAQDNLTRYKVLKRYDNTDEKQVCKPFKNFRS